MTRLFILPLAMMVGSCGPEGVNSASAADACRTALSASHTVQDIAAFFIAHGWEVGRAQKVADAISGLQLPIATGCALLAK